MATGEEILAKEANIESALEALDLRMDDVRGNVVALKATIEELKGQVGGGTPVTQEQLDAIFDGLGRIEGAVGARIEEAGEAAS